MEVEVSTAFKAETWLEFRAGLSFCSWGNKVSQHKMHSDSASESPGVSLPLATAGGGVACRVGCVWARDARIVQAKVNPLF